MKILKRYLAIPIVSAGLVVGTFAYRHFSNLDVVEVIPIAESHLKQNYSLEEELANLSSAVDSLERDRKELREVLSIMFEMGALERAYRLVENKE